MKILYLKQNKKHITLGTWETVSSFSNTKGGWICFGISEDEDEKLFISGVQNLKMKQDFLNVLHDRTKNTKFNTYIAALLPENRLITKDRLEVLAFWTPPKNINERPVYFNNDKNNTFIRVGEADIWADSETINTFFRDQLFGVKVGELTDFGIKTIDEECYCGTKRSILKTILSIGL